MVDPAADLLTADCGNSTIDCRAADGRRLRIESAGDAAADRLRAFVRDVRPARCVAVSVVPERLAALAGVLHELGVRLAVAGRELPCPLRLDYRTPETLGADRWVGALAAHHRCGRAIVVDCGSATTVNLVEADGTFRGGAIAPGLTALVRGLQAAAPALPAPRLDAEASMPPASTQDAVDAGLLRGYCGLVERLVADTLRAASGPARVLVTGGHAERLLRQARLRAECVPALVHEGLVLLAGAR